uniref:Uncharacterized protein n=1 Tax=Podoviridae sp. ctXBg1 TaxID=2827739 RepID=A0A8S5SR37_9CAUD|nr:MAG TPA: hypothetical protein [Podoviridae sp. ctXBg1]
MKRRIKTPALLVNKVFRPLGRSPNRNKDASG